MTDLATGLTWFDQHARHTHARTAQRVHGLKPIQTNYLAARAIPKRVISQCPATQGKNAILSLLHLPLTLRTKGPRPAIPPSAKNGLKLQTEFVGRRSALLLLQPTISLDESCLNSLAVTFTRLVMQGPMTGNERPQIFRGSLQHRHGVPSQCEEVVVRPDSRPLQHFLGRI